MAKEILKNSDKFEVTLVDKKDYQLFQPVLFKAVSSLAEPSEIFSVAALKFSDIFKNEKIKILKKEVESLDFDNNKVILEAPGRGHSAREYDYLVFAAGSEPNFHGMEKNKENVFAFSTFEDILGIKARLDYVFKNKAKREEVNIVVVGGGATGCTLITELLGYSRKLASLDGHPQQTVHFKLIVGRDVLPALSSWMRKNVRKNLEKAGVEILSGSYVSSFTNSGCVLADGTAVPADVIVWAGGVKPSGLVQCFSQNNRHEENHCIYLSPTRHFGIRGHKNVFVLGDAAYAGRKLSVEASTAQSAIHQAKYIADCLIREEKGKKMKNYHPIKSIGVVELGKNIAFTEVGPLRISGRLAGLVHEQGFYRYLKNILPGEEAALWLKEYRAL